MLTITSEVLVWMLDEFTSTKRPLSNIHKSPPWSINQSINQSIIILYLSPGVICFFTGGPCKHRSEKNNPKRSIHWRVWNHVNSYGKGVWELPGHIIWPEPNSQQFNVQATDLFFDVNMTRITPAVADENRKSPSFTFYRSQCDAGRPEQSESQTMETLSSGMPWCSHVSVKHTGLHSRYSLWLLTRAVSSTALFASDLPLAMMAESISSSP